MASYYIYGARIEAFVYVDIANMDYQHGNNYDNIGLKNLFFLT